MSKYNCPFGCGNPNCTVSLSSVLKDSKPKKPKIKPKENEPTHNTS
jgi:hypothetical protein